MAKDPFKYFRIEARELLDQIDRAALELDRGEGASEPVQRLLRLAHTLKGAARVVKHLEIADDSHAIEEVLAPHRNRIGPVPRDAVGALVALVERIRARLPALLQPQPGEAPGATPRVQEDAFQTIRADVAEVDALQDGLAEAHVQLGVIRKVGSKLEHARNLAAVLAAHVRPRSGDAVRGDTQRALSIAEDLQATIGDFDGVLRAALEQMDRELRQVRDAADQLRLIPAGLLFTMLERTARDTAAALGKEVRFEGRGGQTRIDGRVVTTIQAALVQLVRNAVAHGIETDRGAVGKTAEGHLLVEIRRVGRHVIFRCEDDGRGVDVDAVRRIAARKSPPGTEHERMNAEEVLRLLLRGGISTSSRVTEVAGRGVGLDVVREAVERLGGDVRVRTTQGGGTTFELEVPLSIAAIPALLVESAGMLASLPLDAVRSTVRVGAQEITRTASGASFVFDGSVVPFVPLSRILRSARAPASPGTGQTKSAVVVEAGGICAAIGVERLLGTFTVVLRPLPDLAPAAPVVAGVSFDADGNPQMVLDPEGVVRAAAGAAERAPEPAAARTRVLVVDDSLTTRMLEQSILESAGYEVGLATSGEEGLEMARETKYALVLVDVEMPGMDGFTFIEQMQRDPALRDVPAILVTSRSALEDRARGERVGARGYIVKSAFDQSDLLARIQQLAG